MKLLYFSWVRERIGHGEEDLILPAEIKTVGALIDWLKTRGDGYAAALDDASRIKVAVNQAHVAHDAPVTDADEIALFPPVTGG